MIKRRGTNIKGWTSCVECLYHSATGSNSIELQTFGESDTGNSNTDREGSEELDSVKNANALLVAGLRMSDLLGKEGPSGSGATKVYVGSGFPPLPKKLAERIQNLEFVDMAELRPVQWQEMLEPEPDPHKFVILPGLEIARAKRRPVEDVHTWSICLTTYIAAVGHAETPCNDVRDARIHATDSAYTGRIRRAGVARIRPAISADGSRDGQQDLVAARAQIYNQCYVGRARRVDQTKDAGLAVPKHGQESAGGKAKTDCCLIFNQDGSCPYSTNCRYRCRRI